jgi:hypothetical protein
VAACSPLRRAMPSLGGITGLRFTQPPRTAQSRLYKVLTGAQVARTYEHRALAPKPGSNRWASSIAAHNCPGERRSRTLTLVQAVRVID